MEFYQQHGANHTHRKLLSLTRRSTVVNFWNQIFVHLKALTSTLLLCYISVTLEAKIWKHNQFQITPLEDLKKGIVEEWKALPQNVTSREINLYRKHVRMVIRRTSNIFIRFSYWFIVVREKTLDLWWCFFLTSHFCVKRSMSLEPFLLYHRYYPELHICLCTIVTLQKWKIHLDAYIYETTDEWIETLPSLLNSFSRGSFLGHPVFSVLWFRTFCVIARSCNMLRYLSFPQQITSGISRIKRTTLLHVI